MYLILKFCSEALYDDIVTPSPELCDSKVLDLNSGYSINHLSLPMFFYDWYDSKPLHKSYLMQSCNLEQAPIIFCNFFYIFIQKYILHKDAKTEQQSCYFVFVKDRMKYIRKNLSMNHFTAIIRKTKYCPKEKEPLLLKTGFLSNLFSTICAKINKT